MKKLVLLVLLLSNHIIHAQQLVNIKGTITSNGKPLEFVAIGIKKTSFGSNSNTKGYYEINNVPVGSYEIETSIVGYEKLTKKIVLSEGKSVVIINFELNENEASLQEVVITGTMKEVSKLDSPVPIEVYNACFFQANPTPSIFESLQNINGVRPQINCNVCNTGDIHINGLEGPYTMILIDGMPIVSGLSTVYGLTGIPQALIDRVEIVKGPASTLYGSEAVGGLINIITKKPSNAPLFSADVFSTNWADVNTDLGFKFNAGKKAQSILGVNYFNYQNPIDNNNDGFTDVTLQNRISVFNKWTLDRKDNRLFSVAARYVNEDRWGGDMKWNKKFRGGDSIYGESIYTKRWEVLSAYQLPLKEKVMLQVSANGHYQDSYYGTTSYTADQIIAFGQLTWNKSIGKHNDFLLGAAYRYTYYDDNTSATSNFDTLNTLINKPSIITLPGIFLQDEITFNDQHKLLVGIRYDYNSIHGNVFTPRLNYKFTSKNKKNILRVGAGNGYRVANIFTEDHAALTGARKVEFKENLKPETSWNANINFVKKIVIKSNTILSIDATTFYTYFTNRIIPDYQSDVNKIIYSNLQGNAISKGVSINIDLMFANKLKLVTGATIMDVSFTENGIQQRQLLTERFSGVWSVGYTFHKIKLSIDYTGNVYGPMLLPLLGDLDNRAGESPIWSLQNIQITKTFKKGFQIYGGIKNLLNFTPPSNSIARAFDPFDKQVQFDANGQAIATADNPNALTFDPTYVFAPNQGIRGFLGFRYTFNK